MNQSHGRFCQLYRPIGALLLLLAILFLLLRSCSVQTPVAAVPTVEATRPAPTTVAPTSAPPTALPIALPKLNVPAVADYTADGVKLSGTGQPGATVEVWDGATKVGTAVVGADGTWSLVGKLGEGAHKLGVRTVDAAGKILNELPAVDVTVPKADSAAAVERARGGRLYGGWGKAERHGPAWRDGRSMGRRDQGGDGGGGRGRDLEPGGQAGRRRAQADRSYGGCGRQDAQRVLRGRCYRARGTGRRP